MREWRNGRGSKKWENMNDWGRMGTDGRMEEDRENGKNGRGWEKWKRMKRMGGWERVKK